MHLCPLEMGQCMPTSGTVHAPPSSVVETEVSVVSQSCWVLLGSGCGRRLVCWSPSQCSSVQGSRDAEWHIVVGGLVSVALQMLGVAGFWAWLCLATLWTFGGGRCSIDL